MIDVLESLRTQDFTSDCFKALTPETASKEKNTLNEHEVSS